jgi:hypothetical protein
MALRRILRRRAAVVVVALAAVVAGGVPAADASKRTEPLARTDAVKRGLKVISARYTGPGTTTLFRTKAISVVVDVRADDLHDSLLVYTTDRPCAAKYNQAIAQTMRIEQTTGGVSELTDVDLGANAGNGATVRSLGRFAYRYTLTESQAAPAMRTACAMVYDGPGDPRYPGNPHNIPADHVWQRAETRIK